MLEWFAFRGDPSADSAWLHVYGLLLWIDRTTGLAHCYESDKSQPGRHWYARSLAFHDWLSGELRVPPGELSDHLDWLFKHATDELAKALAGGENRMLTAARAQRVPYEGKDLPIPGEDPTLIEIIRSTLAPFMKGTPPPELWLTLIERLRAYLGQENKRKNLVGEGFEDVLAAVASRVLGGHVKAGNRVRLEEVPGFGDAGKKKKPKKVDLVLLVGPRRHRVLVTAKWSIRADREEQFLSDFDEYGRLERDGEPFSYVLVTNEFDGARLLAACDNRVRGKPVFDAVVHVNPTGVLAAYGADPQKSAGSVANHIKNARLIGLGAWLQQLRSVGVS